MRLLRSYTAFLSAPRDIASLVVFRFLFGLLMAGAMCRFMAKGWVSELYIQPTFHFTYPGFEWVRPWPAPLMYLHFVLLIALGLAIAFGFFYRVSAFLFFLGFTYIELIDQTTFLNHYYLISLVSGLMVFLPAEGACSLDAVRAPQLRLDAVPAWSLNLLRFQFGIVYVFAGIAKLNSDWLFQAQPLRIWLAARSDLPFLGALLNQSWIAYVASWTGAIFDCGIIFFLLRKRTRPFAFGLLIVFHVATWILFNIGIFPWLMILGATLFFPPNWPRQLSRKFTSTSLGRSRLQLLRNIFPESRVLPREKVFQARTSILTYACFGIYALVQLAIPMKSYFSGQRPEWTGSGFNCAWRVMIAEKTGYAEFYAIDTTTGKEWKLNARKYLTPRQQVMMAQDPYLIRAMAHFMSQKITPDSFHPIQVRVDAFASLNGRPSQRLINSNVDLARSERAWILPLE